MISQLLVTTFLAAAAQAQPAERLVYALPTTLPAVIPYIALDKGFFKEEGLEVEGKMFSSGREALQALLAGHAQIQSVSETPVVHAILQGNKIVTVATISRHTEAKFIGRKDRGILKPQDIKGKRIATLPGTNSDYFMYQFFKKYGIAVSEVKIANMPPPEMVVAFSKGDIDGYFAWQPHIYYGQHQLPEQSIIFPPGDLYIGRNTVNMDPDFVRAHPETVRKIIRALLKSDEFVKKHPEEALALVSTRLKVEPKILKTLWTENIYQLELDSGFVELMNKVGRWAQDQTAPGKPLPDFRAHIYPDALAKERPSAVKL